MQLVEERRGGDYMENLVGGWKRMNVWVQPVEVLIKTLAGGAFGQELAHGVVDEHVWGRRELFGSLNHDEWSEGDSS